MNYLIIIKSSQNDDTVVILKINREDPKDYELVEESINGDFVYLKKINEFHENFGKFFNKLEEAEKALQEIFQSKPFKF